MKSLVIVESPTKARTIGRFLGKDYEIKASMGHIIDLPKSTLGVDVEGDFSPQFEIVPDKNKIISELKSAAKSASSIILATDPDREGEAIASHVKDMLVSKSKVKSQKSKVQRIVFHEITKEAIEDALEHPRSIDKNLVEAQTARRVLDRLVGYKLSPLLWQKVRRGLSAGRVQSVALRLIVEREREIEKFKKEDYWTIVVNLKKDKQETGFDLIEINGEKIEKQEKFDLYDGEYKVSKTSIDTQKRADEILEDLKTKKYTVSDVLQKETKRSPAPPYTTSTLQQDGARRLGFFSKRTMRAAQKLYEEGFITYHRTDSVNISQSAISSIRTFIKKEFGDKFLPESPRFYKTKQKLAQEAHEAIRITKVNVDSTQVKKELGGDAGKLYDLIWRRAVASQMPDALIESTTVIVDVGNVILSKAKDLDSSTASQNDKRYRLKTTGSVLLFEGFLKVNLQALQDKKLPNFIVSEGLEYVNSLAEKHETPPPPRYNDASLIQTLEEKGIGRPSTYSSIISTIEERRYVERDQNRFVPTPVGVAVNDFLVKNFSDIDDIPFTAEMEDSLDEIANGQKDWVPMIKEFYKPFSKKLEEVKGAERVKIEVEKTNEKCPKCGAPLVIRMGRFGKFFSCSTFPECDFTKQFVEETGFICSKDGGKIIVKKTRKGRKFFGCSNYPACDFASWTKPTSEHVEQSEIPNDNPDGRKPSRIPNGNYHRDDHREKIEDIKGASKITPPTDEQKSDQEFKT